MTTRSVSSDNPWEFFVYDDSWRLVATYKNSGSPSYSITTATALKERYVPHAAGLDGRGSSSYIDSMAVRDLDITGDATLEERGYFIQNWRADLVGVMRPDGVLPGWFKYSAYGKHQEVLLADVDDGSETGTRDGGITIDDFNYFYAQFELGTAEADMTNDGGVAIDDLLLYLELFEAGGPTTASRVMYAGYQYDAKVDLYHVRFRVYSTELGSWLTQDPLGYVSGVSLYEYCGSRSVKLTDPSGLEPNREQAKLNCEDLIAEIQRLEASGHYSRSEVLQKMRDNHTGGQRYFYTTEYGWVDSRHFFEAADTAATCGSVLTELLGFGVEIDQWLDFSPSAFSYEDLPSNAAGAEFGDDYIKPGEKLSDSLARWCKQSDSRKYNDSVTKFQDLPPTEYAWNPAAKKGRKTSSNGSNGGGNSSSVNSRPNQRTASSCSKPTNTQNSNSQCNSSQTQTPK